LKKNQDKMWMFSYRSKHKFELLTGMQKDLFVKLFPSKCYCLSVSVLKTELIFFMVPGHWSVCNSFEYRNLNFELIFMSLGYLAGNQYWIDVFVTFDSFDQFYVNVRTTGVSSCTPQWCVTLYCIGDFFNL
jgi:hypothetical protein